MSGARVVVYAFVATVGVGAADELGVTLWLLIGIGLHARTTAILAALDKMTTLPAIHISRYEDGLNSVCLCMLMAFRRTPR